MTLRTNWWALVLRGIFALILAIAAFALPVATVAALVTLFGLYCLLDGIFAIVSTIRAIELHGRWGGFLLEGIIGILLGLLAIFSPLSIAATFVTLVAIWAIITGILEIVAAVRLRRQIQGEWLLFIGGVVSILFGVILFARPIAGVVLLVWTFGIYGLVFGVTLIMLGLRLRTHGLGHTVRPAIP